MNNRFLLAIKTLFFLLISFNLSLGQINTPAGATNPFGSNLSYAYGILPTNLPTGGTYGKSQDAADAYNEWKSFYVDQTCAGGTQARVKFDDVSKTVSEGIAYGMLLSAYAADKALFDKFWTYYKANVNGNQIMNWKINGCSGTIGSGGATDAELDAAMALIIAEQQWPASNTPYDYAAEASNLITRVKNFEMHSGSYQAINGDGWGFGNSCRNPGYQSPAYYQSYAIQNPSEATFWGNAVGGAYTLINANAHATTGLISDWSDNNGVRNTCNDGYNGYGYDACRNPWRMAVDVMWWNSTNGKNICTKLATYINGQGVSNIRGPRNQDGTGGGNHNATFVSTYALAVVGTTAANQTLMNSLYTEVKNVKDNLQASYPSGYFGNTLRCLSLFVMTGNFWKPGTQASQEINVHVSGTNVLHNGTYDFQNVQNASTKSIVFTIENKGSVGLNLTGTPRVNVTSGAANYSVTAQPGLSSLTGGAVTTFTVLFTPGSNGLKTGTLSIANNDADENPYIINLIGTGTSTATNSEIGVSYSVTNINAGGSHNLGDVTFTSGTVFGTAYATFTITNTGDAPLNITSTPVSAGQGYSLDLAPTSPVAIGGSTTFRVKLAPTSAGTKTGTVTIVNNDPDEGSFVINLTANAVSCATSIINTSVLQDYDANNNVSTPYNPLGAFNAALTNPVIDTKNPSRTVAQYVRHTTQDYDIIRYNSCGANYTLTAAKPIISMLVYSPQIGIPITLSAKKTGNAPIFADYSSDKTLYTTKVNQWERLYFDFSNVVSVTNQFITLDIMIDPLRTKLGSTAADRTYMIDDIRFDANPCITDIPVSEVFNDYDDHRNLSLAYNPSGAFNPVFANPASGGLNTSALVAKYDRLAAGTYDGIRYMACNNGTIDLTGKTTISFLIYSPAAGTDVILSLKKADGADADAYLDAVMDVTTKTTVANQWQRLYFDFEAVKNNSTVLAFDIMIDPLATAGAPRTYYIDDIRYDINPCYTGITASGVMQDYNSNRFLDLANVNAAFNDLIANPSATGINTSSTVARLNRPGTGTYNLVRYKPCGTSFDLSPGKTVYAMDVYSPVANLPVTMLLKLANGTTTLVADSAIVTTANTWTTVTFDFTAALASNTGAFLDIYLDPNITKGAQTYYIDNIRFAPPNPEINVRQNLTNVLTGTSYNMGTITVGASSAEVAFNIQNNGTGDLILSGTPIVAISGTNASEFTINQSTTIGTVGPVSSTTFTITFSPTSGGAKSALITITNNDSNENPYTINLTGTAVAPEINVKQGATTILSGTGSYSFGSIPEATSSSAITFTIENTGSAALILSGTPKVTSSSSDFVVSTTLTTSPVAAAGTTTFTITFSPASAGAKSGTITIANNDSDEGTYTFTVNGTATSVAPEINVKQGTTNYLSGTSTYDFGNHNVSTSSGNITFTIENLGTASLSLSGTPKVAISGTNSADFSITQPAGTSVAASGSVTFTISFTPGATGSRTAMITIANNDSDEGSYTINLTGTGTAPEIDVKQSSSIASGGNYDFGSVNTGASSGAITFTIDNLGTANLNLTGGTKVVLAGTNASEFSVVQPGVSTIAGGASTTFTVTFSPVSTGSKTATLTIANNDANEGSYVINITGTATLPPAPEINITDGSGNVLTGTSYDLGSAVSGTTGSTVTFTIENTGTATLNLTGTPVVVKSGTHNADFTVVQPASSSVAASGSVTFTVTFNPSAVGTRNATLTISNNDGNEGTYTINLTGTGTAAPAPEINITESSVNVPSGNTISLGSAVNGTTGNTATFTIENLGTATLSLTGTPVVVKSGTHNADFTVVQPSSSSLAASGSVTFTVTFNPSATGTRTATLTIASDDADEASYVINLTATSTASPSPEINVQESSADKLTGSTYTFSSQATGTGSTPVVFTIQNTGTAVLNITSVAILGANQSQYSLDASGMSSTVAVGASTTVSVTFAPTTTGTKNASLTINSNDANEATYTINLTGVATAPTGISDALYAATSLSPNPFIDHFTLELGSMIAGNVEVRVKNMLGEEVQASSSMGQSELVIFMSNQPSGVYIVEVQTTLGNVVKRIVKQ